jgi:hypothetical protein
MIYIYIEREREREREILCSDCIGPAYLLAAKHRSARVPHIDTAVSRAAAAIPHITTARGR